MLNENGGCIRVSSTHLALIFSYNGFLSKGSIHMSARTSVFFEMKSKVMLKGQHFDFLLLVRICLHRLFFLSSLIFICVSQ